MKLIFAETHYWESAPRVDSHHLARELGSRGHDVLYLSAPASPWHLGPGRGWPHRWTRMWKYGGWGRQVCKGVRAIVPLTYMPVLNRPGMDTRERVEQSLIKTAPDLQKTIRKFGFEKPDAVIIQSLFFAPMANWFPGVPVIYRMTDDFSAFPGMPRALVDAEPDVVKAAATVTASSHLLAQRARDMGATRVEYLPHGVDLEIFRAAGGAPWELRDRLAVYIGAVDTWFDAGCVAAAARALPDWRFEIIGPVGERADLSAFAELFNVSLLGPVAHAELPAILAKARIGLIPFRRTPLIEAVHPIKLYEYLAAGLHVLATRWDEIARMEAPVILVDGAEEFAERVVELEEKGKNQAGIDYAERSGWIVRASELVRIIESVIFK